jgi:hypothetical protein
MQGKRLRPEDLDEVRKAVEQGGPGVEVLRVMLGHIAALEAEFASLKPSGQVAESLQRKLDGLVAEDAATVEAYAFETGSVLPYQKDARAALSRLATKAQGYDAAVAEKDQLRVTFKQELDAAQEDARQAGAEWAKMKAERDAAVAANAALVEALLKTCRCGGTGWYYPPCPECGDSTWEHACPEKKACDHSHLPAIATQPHPGAALLEQHRKEVAQARDEVLRNADVIAHEATCPRRLRQDSGVECHLACPVRSLYEGFSEIMPWAEATSGRSGSSA